MQNHNKKYKKVFFIDDDDTLSHLYDSELKSKNLSEYLIYFNNAREGFDFLMKCKAEDQPDYILLDLYMPGMDGFEFLRQLSKIKTINESMEIYVCTSSKREEDRKRVMQYPLVSAIMEKPLPDNFLEFLIAS